MIEGVCRTNLDNYVCPITNFVAVPRKGEKVHVLYNGNKTTLETEADYDNFVSEMVSFKNQEHNIKTAVVSRLVDGEIIKEVVF